MNPRIADLFSGPKRIQRLAEGLPRAFAVARGEMPPGNPAVGILREHILIAYFIDEFGKDAVHVPARGTERGFDLIVDGHELSIKTTTGNTNFKVLWTVDSLQIGREIARDYEPKTDIFLVQLHWGKERDSVFYIPAEEQVDLRRSLSDGYLSAAVGSNHRGIQITSVARKQLLARPNTLRASVNWQEHVVASTPFDRWVSFWREN